MNSFYLINVFILLFTFLDYIVDGLSVVPKPIEKIGSCPDPKFLNNKRGKDHCKFDNDCRNYNKCCKSRQGTKVCTLAILDPKEKEGSCPVSERYGLQEFSCRHDTCCYGKKKCCLTGNFGAKCVDPDKPGRCPVIMTLIDPSKSNNCKNKCHKDSSCPGDKKCCFSGCGFACTAPLVANKPGICPNRNDSVGICAKNCEDDSYCPADLKCCTNSCGGTNCMNPVPKEKPGTCPKLPSSQEAKNNPQFSVCPDGLRDCLDDSSCSGDEKCCPMFRCGMKCQSPQNTTPKGNCPDTSDIVTTCEHIEEVNCSHDSECTGGKICCLYGCGKRCLDPNTNYD